MANRTDILAEVTATLDASGNYSGDWFDSADVLTVRYSGKTTVGGVVVYIQQSSDQSAIVEQIALTAATDVPIGCRYFRVSVTGTATQAGQTWPYVLRAVA